MNGRSALFLVAALATAAHAQPPCHGREAQLVVRASAHRLSLCADATEMRSFGVRLGSSGVGKQHEGDDRTPLGTYPLGAPRASEKFGIFIPVGYPTPEQRSAGYTGGAIGVHGPHRLLRWLRGAVNWFDTTNGCVGLATDEEMAELVDWIKRYAPKTIAIER